MIYLLDTNVCIAAINPGESPIKECLARQAPADLALCSVVRAELLWIAAIALAHDLILVSHNTREFSRVEGLRLEDWQCDGDRAS
jgi:predicted nucleic acid-binding protein